MCTCWVCVACDKLPILCTFKQMNEAIEAARPSKQEEEEVECAKDAGPRMNKAAK